LICFIANKGSASVIRTLGNYNAAVNKIALGSVANDIRNWKNEEVDIGNVSEQMRQLSEYDVAVYHLKVGL